MALPERKQSALDAWLHNADIPATGWSSSIRHDAVDRLAKVGLPDARDEYWKYTNPATLVQAAAPEAKVFDPAEAPMFDGIDRLKIVFVDGVFSPDLSDELAGSGLTIERLADVEAKDIHWAKDLYGSLEKRAQDPVARPLATLNTALSTDGIVIHVADQVELPVSLVYLHQSDTSNAMLHHIVKLDEGASLTLLENGPAAARFNKVTEVDVADGASFHHVRTQGRDHERRAVSHMFARLGAASVFKSFTLTVNGRLTRNEAFIEIAGDDATAHIAGAAMGDGDFHHDDTVFVTHDAENCESRQVFKKVLRNGATGVFQGKILVKEGAQKTDGYQISQSLLLDEDSQFLAKPELEIYADDVACSHGSTSGAIDEEALFYLRSRGVPPEDGTDLLVLAFLAEAIDEIENAAVAEDIRSRLEAWLVRHRSL